MKSVLYSTRHLGPHPAGIDANEESTSPLAGLARRLPLLLRPFQLPLEALQRRSSLVGPNCYLTVVAVADSHQDGNISESFLDVSNVLIELLFLLSCEGMSFHGSGHGLALRPILGAVLRAGAFEVSTHGGARSSSDSEEHPPTTLSRSCGLAEIREIPDESCASVLLRSQRRTILGHAVLVGGKGPYRDAAKKVAEFGQAGMI